MSEINNQPSLSDLQEQIRSLTQAVSSLTNVVSTYQQRDIDAQAYEDSRYINRAKQFVKDKTREFVHDSNVTINTLRENLYELPKAQLIEMGDKFSNQYSNVKESTFKTARTFRNDVKIVAEITKEQAVDTKVSVIAVATVSKAISIELGGSIKNYSVQQAKELGSGVSDKYMHMESWAKAKSLTTVKTLSKAKDAVKEYASRSSNSVKESLHSLGTKVSKELSAFWKKNSERFVVAKSDALSKHNEKVAQKTTNHSLGR